ncbi:uncharacterized protein AMSG_12417 [Thecamonas trahens ATCC 50062]|uniref:Pyruvate kinase n=1 Tax=Thecamonas trahens ATCC 50062 TaxID=461836 RepID=A0A0L0DUK4_THETB|nr:hypothetical protein AMSG_12417 [Thecamonas trahens ATCC 50062]KNC55736.1 hypothetical protein AMSG_12417 [Thecamonas trahens ATCC 50062]|eukprot:XP_013752915.1 hypothetical protein AMSG_12417 [Thecamonas trahens ATCC 50062]
MFFSLDAHSRLLATSVATLGPASWPLIPELLRAGVNVFRVNFSHIDVTNKEHTATTLATLQTIRSAAEELGLGDSVGVLADLCGPKVRCNGFAAPGTIMLTAGESVVLEASDDDGEPGIIRTGIYDLVAELSVGHRVLLDDGIMALEVHRRESENRVVCEVKVGGVLKANKGINVPDLAVAGIKALTDKDRADAAWIVAHAPELVDYFALSFVQRPEDVFELRTHLANLVNGNDTDADANQPVWGIIAKIEKPQAVEAIVDIVGVADGVMVARGDLGIECELHRVPRMQKRIIEVANLAGKPVITATQMLESMQQAPTPTRAEIADVANAIFDGTDAVMLSGESAVGKYPIEAVATMVRVARDAEIDHARIHVPSVVQKDIHAFMRTSRPSVTLDTAERTAALGVAAVLTASFVGAHGIVVLPATTDYNSVLLVACTRPKPKALIIAVEHSRRSVRRHILCGGVFPLYVPPYTSADDAMVKVEASIAAFHLVDDYDSLVICSAFHRTYPLLSNLVRIYEFGEASRALVARGRWAAAVDFVRAHSADIAHIDDSPPLSSSPSTIADHAAAAGAPPLVSSATASASSAAHSGLAVSEPNHPSSLPPFRRLHSDTPDSSPLGDILEDLPSPSAASGTDSPEMLDSTSSGSYPIPIRVGRSRKLPEPVDRGAPGVPPRASSATPPHSASSSGAAPWRVLVNSVRSPLSWSTSSVLGSESYYQTSNYHIGHTMGLNIPSGHVVDGIRVALAYSRFCSEICSARSVKIALKTSSGAAVAGAVEKSVTTILGTSGILTAGSTSDTWGMTGSSAAIRNALRSSTFGVAITVKGFVEQTFTTTFTTRSGSSIQPLRYEKPEYKTEADVVSTRRLSTWRVTIAATDISATVTSHLYQCPTSGSWPTTNAGSTASISCPAGYTGSHTRYCNPSTYGWNSPVYSCSKITNFCPAQSAPSNGKLSSTCARSVSTVCGTFSCNAGYTRSGSTSRTCQTNAAWSGSAASCSLTTDYCPLHAVPSNGVVSIGSCSTRRSIGEVCGTFSCNGGYSLNGVTSRTCSSGAVWSGASAPVCTKITNYCPALGAPTNGKLSTTCARSVGVVCGTFSCNAGYSLNGVTSRTCASSGAWTNSAASCALITNYCPLHAVPSNGVVSIGSCSTRRSIGETCGTFSCNGGYTLSGSTSRTCASGAVWSGSAPTCTKITNHCPALSAPANGKLSTTCARSVGTVCGTFSCNAGYVLGGATSRTCQGSGAWSGTAAVCTINNNYCPEHLAPTNGIISPSGSCASQRAIGETCGTFQCNGGYSLNGVTSRTCSSGGGWSGASAPSCAKITNHCPALSAPANGKLSTTCARSVGTVCGTFSCNAGYVLGGATSRTCQGSGAWSGTTAVCTINNNYCPEHLAPTNGIISPSGSCASQRAIGETCGTFQCNGGYSLNGVTSRTCSSGGGWSGASAPSCAKITNYCPALSAPTNGKLSTTCARSVGVVCGTFSCNAGYSLNGVTSRTCASSGSWTSSAASCALITNYCVELTAPTNGIISPSGSCASQRAIGETCGTFQCNAGYALSGSSSRTCSSGAAWSGTAASCSLITTYCPSLTNPTNGQAPSSYARSIGATASPYTCNAGYTISGSTSRTCASGGAWSGSAPTTVGSACSFSCQAGYTPSGSMSVTCSNAGTWSGTLGTCDATPNYCPLLTAPTNGNAPSGHGRTINSVASPYTCNAGYDVSGVTSRTCQAGGSWSSTAPTCVLDSSYCGTRPAAPTNGIGGACSYALGGTCSYSCSNGYEPLGSMSVTCASGPTWSGTLGTCVAKANYCPLLTNPTDGQAPGAYERKITSTASPYTCNNGYIVTAGSTSRTCQANSPTAGTWSGTVPTCSVDTSHCGPSPPPPPNFSIQSCSAAQDGECVYVCNNGYTLSGGDRYTCLANTNWGGTLGSCDATAGYCAVLSAPANGARGGCTGAIGSSCGPFSCNDGYALSGSTSRLCEDNGPASGTWTGSTASCSLITNYCSAKTAPANGCSFTCANGYQPSGMSSITCGSGAAWSAPFGSCVKISGYCTPDTAPANGQAAGGCSGELGTSCGPYTCNAGYTLGGTATRSCNANTAVSGTWTGSAVTCTLNPSYCPVPGTPLNGAVGSCTRSIGGSCGASCNNGYSTNGATTATCNGGPSWSAVFGDCSSDAGYCAVLTAPANGAFSGPCTGKIGSVCGPATCNAGYNLGGTAARSCSDNGPVAGSWSGTPTTCSLEPNYCSAVTAPANALRRELQQWVFDRGATSATCNAGPSWSAILSDCGKTTNYCAALTPPANGAFSGACSGEIGTSCGPATCNAGYNLGGTATRNCVDNGPVAGSWSGSTATCTLEPNYCPLPAAPANGALGTCDRHIGGTCSASCANGYSAAGSGTITCQAGPNWSDILGACTITDGYCAALPAPSNGQFSSACSGRIGSSCGPATCNAGYNLAGSATRNCVDNGPVAGSWDGTPATCTLEPSYCPLPAAPANGALGTCDRHIGGTCSASCANGYSAAGSATITCLDGPNWSDILGACTITDGYCAALPAPSNGQAAGGCNGRIGSSCGPASCNAGYNIGGSATRNCVDNGPAAGSWTGAPVTCSLEPNYCPQPPAPANAVIGSCVRAIGGNCSVSCNNGYTEGAVATTTCAAGPSWTATLTECVAYAGYCAPLSAPTNGAIGACSGAVGTSCGPASCNPGYNLGGSASRTCVADTAGAGAWTGAEATCVKEANYCPQPAAPPNSVLGACDLSIDGTCSFSCGNGYVPSGTTSITCSSGPAWSEPFGTCVEQANYCPAHGALTNGVNPSCNNTIGEDCGLFSCNAGYEITGSTQRTCNDNGPVAGCATDFSYCPVGPDAPGNGTRGVCDRYLFGQCLYACDDGYTLVGTPALTCNEGPVWSGTVPSCEPVIDYCAPITSIQFGTVPTCTNRINEQCGPFACTGDNVLFGSETLTCGTDGQWVEGIPFCSSTSQALSLVFSDNPVAISADGPGWKLAVQPRSSTNDTLAVSKDVAILALASSTMNIETRSIAPAAVWNAETFAFDIELVVRAAGTYSINVGLNGGIVGDSPYAVSVQPGAPSPKTSVASGAGLGLVSSDEELFSQNERVTFAVAPVDSYGNAIELAPAPPTSPFAATLKGDGTGTIVVDYVPEASGPMTGYVFAYTVPVGGLLTLSVTVNELPLADSPWLVQVAAVCPPGEKRIRITGPCVACEADTFSNAAGDECVACPTAMTSPERSEGAGNCTCLPGFYTSAGAPMTPEGVRACGACPVGAVCKGGAEPPFPRPGFYNVGDAFIACPQPSACLGSGACAAGYKGTSCTECQKGFYRMRETCYPCDETKAALVATTAVIVLLCFVGLLVYLNSREAHNRMYTAAAFMIGFNSLQISALYGDINLKWHPIARSFFNILSIANLNIEITSPECSFDMGDPWLVKWCTGLW